MAKFWREIVDAKLRDPGIERLMGVSPHKVMPKSTLVHADQPLIFYLDQTPDEHVELSDFPTLAPRFPAVFLERRTTWRMFGAPQELVPSWQDEVWRRGGWVPGILVEGVDLKRGGYFAKQRARTLRERMVGVFGEEVYADAVRWCLVAYLYSANPKNPVIEGPQVVWLIPVREDGQVPPNKHGDPPSPIRIPLGGAMHDLRTIPAQSAYADAARVYLFPALFAYSMLNSPLTHLTEAGADGLGPRGNTYDANTEELEEVLTTVGGAKEHGIARAMLTCRDRLFHV